MVPKADYQWERTAEERDALDNLTYALQESNDYDEEVLDEPTLMRFLRARNMDIDRAATMLRDYLVCNATHHRSERECRSIGARWLIGE
jgi:hypothetical protein